MKEKYAGLQVNTIEASETPDYLEKIITIDKEFDVNNIQIDSKNMKIIEYGYCLEKMEIRFAVYKLEQQLII